MARQMTKVKQENKKLVSSIPYEKGNKLEELLIDLSNEMVDNQREYTRIL